VCDADVPQFVPHVPRNVPQLDLKNADWNERQQWVLQQLAAGVPLQSKHVQKQFKVTATTVKRDLTPLRKRGLVVFSGPSKTGYWSLT
jgi:predicted HTH transcriptional regulator